MICHVTLHGGACIKVKTYTIRIGYGRQDEEQNMSDLWFLDCVY